MAAACQDGGMKPLQNAMKMAKVAIQLDAGNRHKEAYSEYLRSINYISHALLEDSVSKEEEMVAVEVDRMLRLAEQCLERAKSFIERRDKSPDPAASCSPSQSAAPISQMMAPRTSDAKIVAPKTLSDPDPERASPSKQGHRRVLSEGGGTPSPFLPPEVFQRLQAVESLSRKELTPIEEASRLNQKLKANYEARLARLAPGQATQKTSLTLSLQRQMMENLIIAKARQDALQRKMEERRLRLQEEANRRFSASGTMTPEEQEQRFLYANVLEYEQDHDWPKQWKANLKKNPDDATLVSSFVAYLLSRVDHPVVQLLRKHQYRVYNRLYPIVSKVPPPSPSLPLKPSLSAQDLHPSEAKSTRGRAGFGGMSRSLTSDPSLSSSFAHDHHTHEEEEEEEEVERDDELSLDRENSFEDLEQFLTDLDWAPPHSSDLSIDGELTFEPTGAPQAQEVIQDLEMRALKEHLKAVVKDIHIAVDQLLSLCLLSFECLNTSDSKDLCLAGLEEAFFTPLWSPLLALFRKVYRDREQALQCSMDLYRDASPADIGVSPKLFPQDLASPQGSYPYESAVQELRSLCRDCCPQRKLECVVRALRMICACAEDYRALHEADSAPKTAAIGADDLLPILSFVALRCECPQLMSECAALEEFIHEGYLIGEEGYCLTSMQSALSYVESLYTGGAPLAKAT
ncbi:VPS9 domain-containing protein 1 [Aplochiton taeniatus]